MHLLFIRGGQCVVEEGAISLIQYFSHNIQDAGFPIKHDYTFIRFNIDFVQVSFPVFIPMDLPSQSPYPVFMSMYINGSFLPSSTIL